MKRIINLNETVKLSIGPYIIRMSHQKTKNNEYYLPGGAEIYIEKETEDKQENLIDYKLNIGDVGINSQHTLVVNFNEGPVPYKIYRTNSGEYLWIRQNYYKEIHLAYRISEDWGKWELVVDNSGNQGSDSFNELSYIFPYSILSKSGIMFHGVVMEWQGKGIIVCAHSGVGKTTHTRMWRDSEKALIINGDRGLCYEEQGEWYTCGAPWNGSSGEVLNRSIKLTAIVVLEQAEMNQITMLPPLQGAFELIQLAFAPPWEETLLNFSLDHINDIVQKIPVYKLRCRADLEAVAVLKNELLRRDDNRVIQEM